MLGSNPIEQPLIVVLLNAVAEHLARLIGLVTLLQGTGHCADLKRRMSYIDYINESVRSPEQELDDLSKANGFTAVELAMNRLGKIGAGQVSEIIEEILRPLVKSFLVVLGWLLLIILTTWIISAGIHVDAHRPFSGIVFLRRFWLFRGLYVLTFVRLGAVIMVISCAGAFIVAAMTATVNISGMIRDAWDGKVAAIEGRVYATEEEKRGSPWDAVREQWTRVRQERDKIYRYAVRDVAVEVSYAGFRALASGGHYKLYYTPRSKLLLSIEPAPAGTFSKRSGSS